MTYLTATTHDEVVTGMTGTVDTLNSQFRL